MPSCRWGRGHGCSTCMDSGLSPTHACCVDGCGQKRTDVTSVLLLLQVLVMEQRTRLKLAAAAQSQASQFSTERFQEGFLSVMEPVLPQVDGEQEQQQQPRTVGSNKQQQNQETKGSR